MAIIQNITIDQDCDFTETGEVGSKSQLTYLNIKE